MLTIKQISSVLRFFNSRDLKSLTFLSLKDAKEAILRGYIGCFEFSLRAHYSHNFHIIYHSLDNTWPECKYSKFIVTYKDNYVFSQEEAISEKFNFNLIDYVNSLLIVGKL